MRGTMRFKNFDNARYKGDLYSLSRVLTSRINFWDDIFLIHMLV